MQETAVFVVIEIVSVEDPAGLQSYARRAGALIGSFGGELLGQGGSPIDGEPGFAPLVIQRWPSESAFRAWVASDVYRPLNELRLASATMKAAIISASVGPNVA